MEDEFLKSGCRRVWQIFTGVVLNGFIDIIGPLVFGLPWLYLNGPLVLEDVGVRLWV